MADVKGSLHLQYEQTHVPRDQHRAVQEEVLRLQGLLSDAEAQGHKLRAQLQALAAKNDKTEAEMAAIAVRLQNLKGVAEAKEELQQLYDAQQEDEAQRRQDLQVLGGPFPSRGVLE